MKKALFIFRRDLRLEDNTALYFALKSASCVIPAFIFTPQQIEKNPYYNEHCLQFMIESLEDLDSHLKNKQSQLYLFHGPPQAIVAQCIDQLKIDGVIFNKDYTPYSIKRDKEIKALCHQHQIACHSFDDALLHPPEEVLKPDGKPYTIFTPFYRTASKIPVPLPVHNRSTHYFSKTISFAKDLSFLKKILPKKDLPPCGGIEKGLQILKKINALKDYETIRDFPDKNGTSHLSSHLKFTTLSIREVYHTIVQKLGPSSELIRSLYWRDFFTSIAFHFPFVFESSFHAKFNSMKWSYDHKKFDLWCSGATGFPIIDAGMREMNQTGYMHNRVRMIAASFLVKDLHIDWKWGEKYFAQNLIDYDPAVNNGNWQWSAGTGCDAQPFFRIFNPWTQAKKFDPECLYIKRWVPELKNLPASIIHEWHLEKHHHLSKTYPSPIVDHAKEAKKSLTTFKAIQT